MLVTIRNQAGSPTSCGFRYCPWEYMPMVSHSTPWKCIQICMASEYNWLHCSSQMVVTSHNGCSFLISEQGTTWMRLTDGLGCTLKTCTQMQWQRSNQPSFLSSPLSHTKIMGQHFGDRKEFNTYWAIKYSWSTIMYCLCMQLEEPRKTMEISYSILDMIAGYFSNANQVLNTLFNLVSAAGSLSWQEFWIIMDFEIEFCVKRTRTELLHLDLGCG